MQKLCLSLGMSLLLTAGLMFGQATTPAPTRDTGTKARAEGKKADDVTHGTVKEFTAKQKIVIAIDNAPDKTFDLTDKSVAVKLGKGLKVGDAVMVAENDTMGKTHSVSITKHTAKTKK